jgi:hypothetical protein
MPTLATSTLANRLLLASRAARARLSASGIPNDSARALLELGDALNRLLFLLSGEDPLPRFRAWRNEPACIPVGALLEEARQEFAVAIGAAELATPAGTLLDPAFIAELRALLADVALYSARVNGSTRGGRLLSPAPEIMPAPAAASPPTSAGATPPIQGEKTAPVSPPASAPPPADDTHPPLAPAPAPAPENVAFIASAPAKTCAGDEFVARFAAYLPQDETAIRAALAEAAPAARLSPAPKSGGLVRNTAVEIVLECKALRIDGADGRAARQFVWDGKPQIVEFEVAVSPNEPPRKAVLKFYVRIAGIVLERILLELEIDHAHSAAGDAAPTIATKRLPSTAFASYSSRDRSRVIDRVAAIRIAAGIDVFLDCMDLNPSELWEPRLYGEIAVRELFILFWSQAAQQSRWVALEYEHALRVKGLAAMQIQPLENGVKPPKALAAVHFADPYADLAHAARSREAQVRDEANDTKRS